MENRVSNNLLKIFYVCVILGIIIGIYTFLINKYTFYLMEEEVVLNEGDIYQVELLPENSDIYNINNYRFSSTNKKVLVADSYGLVQGIKEGTAKIGVRYKYGIISKKVNVKVEKVEVKSITIDDVIELEKNSTKRVKPLINNDEKINSSLKYSTDDSDILKVDNLGNITGLREGKAKLFIESSNGVKAETVVKVSESISKIEEIKFVEDNIRLAVDETKEARLDIYPANASTEDIIWSSSNSEAVSVDFDGYITGISEGYSIITATSESGLKASMVVLCGNKTDYVDSEKIVISESNMVMYIGEERSIFTQIVPPSNNKRPIYLISTDSDIVSVSTGKLVAKKVGKTTVNVKTDDEDIASSINVIVKDIKTNVESISINNDNNISLYRDDDIRLSVTISPDTAQNRKVKWTSSDESVAKVSSTGIVIGVKRGTARITAESHNGKKDSINVVVRDEDNDLLKKISGDVSQVLNVNVNKGVVNINEGMTRQLGISNNEKVEWTSDSTDNVKVDSNGKVTAIKEGYANITAKYDNGKTISTRIKVIEPILNSIKVSDDFVRLNLVKTNDNEIKDYDTYQIETSFNPNNFTDVCPGDIDYCKDLEYKISSEPYGPYASIDENGVITPIKCGQATIEVIPKANVNIKEKITLNIVDPNLKNASINEKDILYFKIGDEYQIKASFTPSDIENKKILYNIIDGNGSIINGNYNGKFTMLSEGEVTLYVYPMANAKYGKKIKFVIGHGFMNDCTSSKAYEKKEIKSNITGKKRTFTSYICLDNIEPIFQNMAVSADYVYGTSPVHAWCVEGQKVSINSSVNGTCTKVDKNNYISSSNARVTSRYLGTNALIKIDRRTGRIVSKNLVEFAGHGQSLDVTSDNKIYLNYLSNTELENEGRIGGGSTGVGFINGITNEKDSKVIYPSTAVKISSNGAIKLLSSSNTLGSANYNTDILSLSTDNPMYFPQIAIDETKDRVAIMDFNLTKNGNRAVYTYNLTKFMNGQKSSTNTVYTRRRYIGKVCGMSSQPINCGGQGIEVYDKYIYTVQDYKYKGIEYANITKIDYASCPETDTSKSKCSKVENIFLRKDKYVDTSSPGYKTTEIEGISIFAGRTYITLFDKYEDTKNYKSKVVLVYGF